MKLVPLGLMLLLTSTFVAGQNPPLPEILIPSISAQSEAAQLGVDVFKLLPRGTYENPTGNNKDEANPLGIRQGGSYYSFSTGSHSYNKVPQIELGKGGELSVGFYGSNYGMIADLGRLPFADVESDTPELAYMKSYQPPKLEKDANEEQKNFRSKRVDGLVLTRSLPAILGHTYLLRAVSFEEADILVGLTVVEIANDGSVAIAWKKLSEFENPIKLSMPDADMKAAIEKIISDNGIFKGVEVSVKDNVLSLKGQAPGRELQLFWTAASNLRIRRGVSSSYGLEIK